MNFGTFAWTIELYMTKYIIGEILSSGGATLYKNPSDQTVQDLMGGFPHLLDVYGGNLGDVSIITLAPELDLDCSVIKECTKNGVTISIGHSAATLKQAEAAFRSGARSARYFNS